MVLDGTCQRPLTTLYCAEGLTSDDPAQDGFRVVDDDAEAVLRRVVINDGPKGCTLWG